MADGVVVSTSDSATPTAASTEASALQLAQALTRDAPVPSSQERPLDSAAVDAEGLRLRSTIPLPPGGSLDDVGFASSGGAPLSDVRFVAQFNAMCDWYRYVLTAPPSATTLAVIKSIGSWSQLRENQSGKIADEVASKLEAGNPSPLKEQLGLNCTAR